MKKQNICLQVFICLLCISIFSTAQTVNWSVMEEQRTHLINPHLGLEYGIIYGAGYGYTCRIKNKPVVFSLDLSTPAGKTIFDDFKIKAGGQLHICKYKNMRLAAKLNGISRRLNSEMVKALNLGVETGICLGYYKPKWFLAAEAGYDKALVTQLQHTRLFKENYPAVVDGWYASTGGNIYYGLQTGFSCKQTDVYVKGGKIVAENFRYTPLLPFYFELGFNYRLKKKNS